MKEKAGSLTGGKEGILILLSLFIHYGFKLAFNFDVKYTFWVDIIFAIFLIIFLKAWDSGMINAILMILFLEIGLPLLGASILGPFEKYTGISIAKNYVYLTILNPWLTPWWFYYFAVIRNSGERFILRAIRTGVIVFWLIYLFTALPLAVNIKNIASTAVTPEQTKAAINIYNEVWTSIKKFPNFIFVEMPKKISQAWKKQIAIASGDYYTGEVDKNAKEKLGVYIENMKQADANLYEDDRVTIWANIKARTLERDASVSVKVSCKAKGNEKEIEGDADIVNEKEKTKTFSMARDEVEDIDCVFYEGELEKGSYSIKFNAEFNFTTMSYIKSYFIDKERLRSFTREGIDVFNFYKITDKSPVAIYTNGPVMVGMETSSQPVGISEEADTMPKLGITIQNNWEGKIKRINELIIYVPDSMEIDLDSCDHAFEKAENLQDEDMQESYNAYRLKDNAKDNAQLKDIKEFQSFNCRIDVKKDKTSLILKNEPISTQYFKATIRYVYDIEQALSVEVKSVPGFNVYINPAKPSLNDEIKCIGKHSDKDIVSAEHKFMKEGDAKEFRTLICSEKRKCTATLLEEGIKKGDKIVCEMKIKTSDEKEETDSDSAAIINSAPKIKLINADKATGAKPLEVSFSAEATDADNDQIKYLWDFNGDGSIDLEEQNPKHKFNEAGNYEVKLIAQDSEGGKSAVKTKTITVTEAAGAPKKTTTITTTAT